MSNICEVFFKTVFPLSGIVFCQLLRFALLIQLIDEKHRLSR